MKGQPKKATKNKKARKGKDDWVKKCVANFSLYTDMCLEKIGDPYEEQAAIENGEFKTKVSKSTKKRLRRQIKKKALGVKVINLKKITKKQAKRDVKSLIDRLSKI